MANRNSSPTIKHVVIGTGPLGRATAAALANQGQQVVLVNRSGKLDGLPKGAAIVAGDLADLSTLQPVVEDAAAIYFCAQPPYHRWVQEFPSLQDAVIRLTEWAGANLIVAENLYGYGPVRSPMTETTPLRPNSRKGRVRADMHQSLMDALGAGRINVAVARGSDFFGPYVDGSAVGARVFKAIVSGKATEFVGDLDALHSYTFVEDFGAALATLGMDGRSLGQVWHVPNPPAVSSRQFLKQAFAIAGTAPRFRKIGSLEMNVLGMFIPPLREMAEMVYEFEEAFVVDDSKFKRVFGDIATPLNEALERTLGWTRT
jgi:nucleoside-diphosphate-sugar epimerase